MDEWLIFPNTHEAIVTQEEFDLVQSLRKTTRRIDHLGAANPLTGILFCADCGAKLHNHRNAHADKHHKTPMDVYRCSTYLHTGRRFDQKCTCHNISTAAVREIILTALRRTTGYVRAHEAEFVEKVREASVIQHGETAKAHRKQIAKSERRLADLDRICKSLYEDKALGRVTEAMYDEMVGGYNEERVALCDKTAALTAELEAWQEDNAKADKFLDIVRRYTCFEELTPQILHEFVDKVIVHEGEWSDGYAANGRPLGKRTQRVDVYLKYIGNFDVPEERTPEEIEAERIADEKLERRREYFRLKTREHNERKRQRAVAESTVAVTDTAS